LFAATGIEKQLRLRLSIILNIMIAAIALDRAKLQHTRVPVRHRRQDHKENRLSLKKKTIIGKIGKFLVRNHERDKCRQERGLKPARIVMATKYAGKVALISIEGGSENEVENDAIFTSSTLPKVN
jgi:hypothetical protein